MGFMKDVKKAVNEVLDNEKNHIRVFNGRWQLNGKTFDEMTLKERQLLDKYIAIR